MFFVTLAALAASPSATLTWKGTRSTLVFTAPDGFEISPDAPVDLRLSWDQRSLRLLDFGAAVTDGVPLGPLQGTSVEGVIDLQVCDKSSGTCTPTTLAVAGSVPAAKKGVLDLSVTPVEAPMAEVHESAFNTDGQAIADAAFSRAKTHDTRVILDFSAVWCPPCNLLAAEVLHAPDADAMLEGYELAVVDVDHKSSWTLKDRYDVGGYPTVVLVEADGTEIDRLVGYPGKEAFLEFLAGGNPDYDAMDPSTLTADEAAEGWWSLVQDGAEDLNAWEKAATDSDSVEAHLARFVSDPNLEEADWLSENAPRRTLDWLPWAIGLSEDRDASLTIHRAIRGALPHVSSVDAADLLYFNAKVFDDDPTLFAAAFATLRSSLTGDDTLDRAHWTFLATLQAKSGDLDGAIAFLDSKTRTHPDEPTFLLKAATLLNDAERHEEALKRTKLAMSRAWGDNQLRVAHAHCVALEGLGRADEARATADKMLHQQGPPGEDVDVRTHRYREKLEAFLN